MTDDYLAASARQLDGGAPSSGATDTPCPRCGEPMGTILFGLRGSPFCVACLEPLDDAATARPSDGQGEGG